MEAMAEALDSLARGEFVPAAAPVVRPAGRVHRAGADARATAAGERPLYALKTVCLFPDNPTRGLDAHQGTVTLFAGETGEVRAVMNASAITAIRTAAVSGVATRLLAREDARVLAILGAGARRARTSRRCSRRGSSRTIRDRRRARARAPSGSPPTGRSRVRSTRPRRRSAAPTSSARSRSRRSRSSSTAGWSPARTSTPSARASRTRASSTATTVAALVVLHRPARVVRERGRRLPDGARRRARSPTGTSRPSSARCSPALHPGRDVGRRADRLRVARPRGRGPRLGRVPVRRAAETGAGTTVEF